MMRAVFLILILSLVMGCVSGDTPTEPEASFVPRELELIIKPNDAATFLLNPSAVGKGGYAQGMVVTIDILPNEGWEVEEWIGPVFNVEGRKAQIQMDSSQSIAVTLVREGAFSGGQAPESPRAAINPTLAVLVERIRPSVVQIRTSEGSGSGFIFETDYPTATALVMTNAHVVKKARNVDVIVDDSKTLNGKVLGANHDQDIAVIEICCGEFRALEFGDAIDIAEGTDVFNMGYPVPYTSARYDPGMPSMASVIKGIVSRNYFDSERNQWVIQYDAGSNPGNSGGALFNMSGKVVGLHFQGYIQLGYQDMAFAVSQVAIAQHLPALKGGYSAQPATNQMHTSTPYPTYTPPPIPTPRVIIVTPTPTPTPRPTPTPNATSYYNKGRDYYNDAKYQQAIDEFDTAIRLNGNYSSAYWYRGISYTKLDRHQRGIEDYDKAIELDPNEKLLYINRGHSYSALGQYERAIEDYDKAISLDPDDKTFYGNRGISYGKLSQYERAIEDYDKAISLDPDYKTAYGNRGNAYYSLKQYQRAIEDYGKVIAIEPDGAQSYKNRGLAYGKLGEYGKKNADDAKACSLDSKYC